MRNKDDVEDEKKMMQDNKHHVGALLQSLSINNTETFVL